MTYSASNLGSLTIGSIVTLTKNISVQRQSKSGKSMPLVMSTLKAGQSFEILEIAYPKYKIDLGGDAYANIDASDCVENQKGTPIYKTGKFFGKTSISSGAKWVIAGGGLAVVGGILFLVFRKKGRK